MRIETYEPFIAVNEDNLLPFSALNERVSDVFLTTLAIINQRSRQTRNNNTNVSL